MTRVLALTTALALALAGYAAAFAGAEDPCITVTYTDHAATRAAAAPGVITTTVTPIPPGC